MTPLSRLRELSARSTQIKELGLLTKNTPAYDKDGTFTGVENHYNGPGIAEAAGGAALVGAGLGAGHVGIMKKYGTETVRREKGRFIKPKEVKRSVAGAYKAAGADALGALKRVVGKRFSAKEFARGDRAIPAMKAILKASKEAPLHLNGVEGAAVAALRGNVHQVRRALNRFWGESASAKEAALHMKGVRSWAAGEIRGERTLPKDLRAWAPAPSYKVIETTLSAKDRLKEFGKLPRLTLAIQRQGILTRGEAVSVPQSYRYGIDYGPEAVNHYGGNKKLIEDAIKNRAKIRSEIKSRVSMLSAKDRLRELAASSTFLKSFDEKLDENGHPIRDAAVGAGLGAGAVLGHQAVMKKYGQDGAGIGQAYGAAANDFKGGFTSSFNPPSTSAGSGSVATAATNSPLSADAAKLGGVAKAGEEASVLSRAGSKVGALGAAIRGFLSRMR